MIETDYYKQRDTRNPPIQTVSIKNLLTPNKENSLYSQAFRLRKISTKLKTQNDKLKRRGYSHTLIENYINKAISTPRQDAQKLKWKEKLNRISLITKFIKTLPPLVQIIKNGWDILKLSPNLKEPDTFR